MVKKSELRLSLFKGLGPAATVTWMDSKGKKRRKSFSSVAKAVRFQDALEKSKIKRLM